MSNFIPVLRPENLLFTPGFFEKILDDIPLTKARREKGETWSPSIDISETNGEFLVKVEVPGVDSKDLEVTLTQGLLTIRGEKKFEQDENRENYHRIERQFGSFARSLRLPDNVDNENIEARYKDGVLHLTIPKVEITEFNKKIEVKYDQA